MDLIENHIRKMYYLVAIFILHFITLLALQIVYCCGKPMAQKNFLPFKYSIILLTVASLTLLIFKSKTLSNNLRAIDATIVEFSNNTESLDKESFLGLNPFVAELKELLLEKKFPGKNYFWKELLTSIVSR